MVEILLQNELINMRPVTDNYNEKIKLFFSLLAARAGTVKIWIIPVFEIV